MNSPERGTEEPAASRGSGRERDADPVADNDTISELFEIALPNGMVRDDLQGTNRFLDIVTWNIKFFDLALAMAEQAVALLPERAPQLDTLAMALDAEGQLPRALETQRRAVEIDPKDGMLRQRLAKLLIKKGDKSGAREELPVLSRMGRSFAAQAEVGELMKGL